MKTIGHVLDASLNGRDYETTYDEGPAIQRRRRSLRSDLGRAGSLNSALSVRPPRTRSVIDFLTALPQTVLTTPSARLTAIAVGLVVVPARRLAGDQVQGRSNRRWLPTPRVELSSVRNRSGWVVRIDVHSARHAMLSIDVMLFSGPRRFEIDRVHSRVNIRRCCCRGPVPAARIDGLGSRQHIQQILQRCRAALGTPFVISRVRLVSLPGLRPHPGLAPPRGIFEDLRFISNT